MEKFLHLIDPPKIFSNNIIVSACHFNLNGYHDDMYEMYDIPVAAGSSKAVVKRRSEFLAGRYCAKLSLKKFQVENFIVRTGEKREPIWPATIVGSISHSQEYAIAIVASAKRYLGVGVDVETVITKDTAFQLKKQVFTKAEITRFAQDDSFEITFTICFSLKESFFKAAFPLVQRYFDFSAVTVQQIDWRTNRLGTIKFVLNETLSASYKKGNVYTGQFSIDGDQVITSVEL